MVCRAAKMCINLVRIFPYKCKVIYSGTTIDDSKYDLNTIAVVKCDPEHVYSGSSQHVCMGYGKWSGRLGLCIEK
ncbi:unnamed protein product [Brugia pahangi]|uniref:Sushi domain-containing protein n=1 Tax=Brugia pahangi TaxID=6280 RepID=A0A0N4TDH0_BRUPA|nr:unnamed protein product [Brugia pahangi]